jgi:hypothetical protein
MPALSGRYSCEVSADAPSFHTALVSGDMNVVGEPIDRLLSFTADCRWARSFPRPFRRSFLAVRQP